MGATSCPWSRKHCSRTYRRRALLTTDWARFSTHSADPTCSSVKIRLTSSLSTLWMNDSRWAHTKDYPHTQFFVAYLLRWTSSDGGCVREVRRKMLHRELVFLRVRRGGKCVRACVYYKQEELKRPMHNHILVWGGPVHSGGAKHPTDRACQSARQKPRQSDLSSWQCVIVKLEDY